VMRRLGAREKSAIPAAAERPCEGAGEQVDDVGFDLGGHEEPKKAGVLYLGTPRTSVPACSGLS